MENQQSCRKLRRQATQPRQNCGAKLGRHMKNVSPSSAIAQNCAAKPRRRRRLKLRRRTPPSPSEKCAAKATPSQNRATKLCRHATSVQPSAFPNQKCAAKLRGPAESAPPIPLPPKNTSPNSASVRKARRQDPAPTNPTDAQNYTPQPRRRAKY